MAIINRSDREMDFSDGGSPTSYTQVFNLTTAPKSRSDYDIFSLTAAYDFPAVARVSNTISYLKETAAARDFDKPLALRPG